MKNFRLFSPYVFPNGTVGIYFGNRAWYERECGCFIVYSKLSCREGGYKHLGSYLTECDIEDVSPSWLPCSCANYYDVGGFCMSLKNIPAFIEMPKRISKRSKSYKNAINNIINFATIDNTAGGCPLFHKFKEWIRNKKCQITKNS